MEGTLKGSIADVLEGQISGSIELLAGEPVLDDITITENGHYTPPSGVDGYDDITVNVPSTQPVLDDITINENGHYTPPSGVDGYDDITVYVPYVSQGTTINDNGTYTPPSGVDGFSQVIVNVSNTVQGLQVTENGTYTPPVGSGVVGYSPVTVNVTPPSPVTSILNATHNGTFYPQLPSVGFSEVIVDVHDSDIIPITQSEYDILPEAEKMNGKFYQISAVSSIIDMTDATILKQGSMSVTLGNGSVSFSRGAGTQIGCNTHLSIDVTNIEAIEYNLATGTFYGGGNCNNDTRALYIGVGSSPVTSNYVWYVTLPLLYNAYMLANKTYIKKQIDVSNLTGVVYLNILGNGVNMDMTQITAYSNLTKFMYMGNTYIKK